MLSPRPSRCAAPSIWKLEVETPHTKPGFGGTGACWYACKVLFKLFGKLFLQIIRGHHCHRCCNGAGRATCGSIPRVWVRRSPGRRVESMRLSHANSPPSAPFTASALSVTVFSNAGACTETFSAKKRASAT